MKKSNKEISNYLQRIVESIGGSIYWKDKSGAYLGANTCAAKMVGLLAPKEIIGKTDYDLFTNEEANVFRANDIWVMNNGEELVKEELVVSPGKKQLIQLSTKKPLYDTEGHIIGIIGNTIDITDRKKAEEELIKTKAAKQAIELADKAKTAFLENMRHDLRTALSGIQGFSELLRDEWHDENKNNGQNNGKNNSKNNDKNNSNSKCNSSNNSKKAEYIDNLVTSCRALTNIHNQILHAIQVFSGDVPVYKEKFNFSAKLKQIVDLHLAKADEKGLKINLRCDKKIPKYFVGDCRRFNAVALELVANALKYTETGKVTVTASMEKKQDDKYVIKFSVQDTGVGIAEDKKAEIFTRFNRLTPSYEGKYIGLGLGLSVVKQYVDDLGGEIYVASKPQHGTTFTCFLPFIKSLSNDDKNVEEDLLLPLSDMEIGDLSIRPEVKKTSKNKQQGKNTVAADTSAVATPVILQVEDEEICAVITNATLSKYGFVVDLARTGNEALEKFNTNHYDLILMDVGLPDISGIEVTRKIRVGEKSTRKHTPIVALTAHVDSDSKQQCIESGMDAVLSKPVAGDKFVDILNAFIPRRAAMIRQKIKAKRAAQTKTKLTVEDEGFLELDGPVIDVDYMQKNFLYSAEDTKHLLQDVAAPSLAREMKAFQAAYREKEWSMVQKIAHKMSGACSSCGLKRLWAICKRLELYLMGKNTKLLKVLVDAVTNEYKSACMEIKKL